MEGLGLYELTKYAEDVGKFRTAALRNIRQTKPYMHNGMFILDELHTLYNAVMRTLRARKDQADDPLFPEKSPLLKPLHLNEQDFVNLKAFLHALNEPRAESYHRRCLGCKATARK